MEIIIQHEVSPYGFYFVNSEASTLELVAWYESKNLTIKRTTYYVFKVAGWATIGKEYEVQFGATTYGADEELFDTSSQPVQSVTYIIASREFTDQPLYDEWLN